MDNEVQNRIEAWLWMVWHLSGNEANDMMDQQLAGDRLLVGGNGYFVVAYSRDSRVMPAVLARADTLEEAEAYKAGLDARQYHLAIEIVLDRTKECDGECS